MTELELLKRKLEREQKARKQAEAILEQKALDLFHANEELRKLNENLEQRIAQRTKELERSEQKYRGIMENMELGLLEVDRHHKIIRAYDKFCKMVDYSPEELVEKNAVELFLPEGFNKTMQEQDKKRTEGQTGVYEVQIKKKDGSLIWVLISGAPIFDMQGNIVGSIGIHYDITQRILMQEDLAAARKVAEDAQKAERQFIARMSHEIRTPLNAIIGMSHLLFDTPLNEEQKQYAHILKSSSDILQSLITDILDFSKIQAGGIKPQKNTFDLFGLLNSLEKTFKFRNESSSVDFLVDIDEKIDTLLIGDDLLLNQILLNLLSNAFKFTKQGEIKLTCQLLRKEKNNYYLEFKIADSGIGIAEEKLKLIFENFKQADNEISKQYGGTGLGLAITKQLTELQGGKIWVESKLNRGTDFYVQLKYGDSGSPLGKSIDSSENISEFPVGPIKILVVEDNYMNRQYISALFKKWNIKFVLADNGKEGLEKAKMEKFDLIFMDISMPEMDGYESTIHIRNELNPNKDTPIVALTASALISKKDKALKSGMTDYLLKPFEPKQILQVIEKYTAIKPNNVELANEKKDSFSFDRNLDVNYLDEFYQGDLEYAIDMFDTFLKYLLPEMQNLKRTIKNENWESAKALAHKIKPSLSMVGLTGLSGKMHLLENGARQKVPIGQLALLFAEIESSLEIKKALLEKELKRMKKYLSE
ncbi:MAG: response regulator [Bacteroidota bacterium]